MAAPLSDRDWQIRLHIYRFIVEQTRPPTVAETAGAFGMSAGEARDAYQRLHEAHMLFLEPGTSEVRMANPLSGVATPFRVIVDGRTLFANCAWDSLGIPAMLGTDTTIEAIYTGADGSSTPARYAIVNGALRGDDGIVHFPLPFRHWYDDLIHT
ncbi:MAG: organomercurial lyase [Vicinamibacterales bacterium]